MVWIWLAVSIILGAAGQILMKIGMKRAGEIPTSDVTFITIGTYFWNAIWSGPLLLAVFVYGGSFLLWLAVLSKQDLSLARPLMSVGYLITLFYGVIAGEDVTWQRTLGTFFIIAGVFFLVQKK